MPKIQLISIWQKSYEDIYHSPPHVSVTYYRKHPNNNSMICLLQSCSCCQQHFHDWFCVLRSNSDLLKLEWTLLLFDFNYICDLTYRSRLCSIPVAEHASFSHQARMLKTNLLGLVPIISKYCFKVGTICLLLLYSNVFLSLWNLIAIILVFYFEK